MKVNVSWMKNMENYGEYISSYTRWKVYKTSVHAKVAGALHTLACTPLRLLVKKTKKTSCINEINILKSSIQL